MNRCGINLSSNIISASSIGDGGQSKKAICPMEFTDMAIITRFCGKTRSSLSTIDGGSGFSTQGLGVPAPYSFNGQERIGVPIILASLGRRSASPLSKAQAPPEGKATILSGKKSGGS